MCNEQCAMCHLRSDSNCSLFIAHCSLFIAHCSLLIVHCSLLIVHCSLFIVHCSLFIAHCSLGIECGSGVEGGRVCRTNCGSRLWASPKLPLRLMPSASWLVTMS